ncbi:hypothetical protein BC940DRAFT_294334 [Gongronella butleri]|nr:hypothetical protein BC940DRAFT_294334 [Gongronella butleri]
MMAPPHHPPCHAPALSLSNCFFFPRAMPQAPPCQKFACAIQDCLERNKYQEDKCRKQLDALKACCDALLAKGESSPCCPKKRNNTA